MWMNESTTRIFLSIEQSRCISGVSKNGIPDPNKTGTIIVAHNKEYMDANIDISIDSYDGIGRNTGTPSDLFANTSHNSTDRINRLYIMWTLRKSRAVEG